MPLIHQQSCSINTGSGPDAWELLVGSVQVIAAIIGSHFVATSLFNRFVSLMRREDTDSQQSPAIVNFPGGKHEYQIVTEPQAMEKEEMPMGSRSDHHQSYRLQYETIDEMTQTGDLTNEINLCRTEPVALGGFSDIYRGKWRHRVSIDNRNEFHEATTLVSHVLAVISVIVVNAALIGRCETPSCIHKAQS
ncbi:hypothetical protein AX15_006705 [Amanita polypyramis BW_CC]|nr:hypothetical protein AX15_006705 [Amanita polypyramis BW_CC]